MMMVFMTFNSSLVPLIEGLCSSNPCEFEFSGFRRNRTDDRVGCKRSGFSPGAAAHHSPSARVYTDWKKQNEKNRSYVRFWETRQKKVTVSTMDMGETWFVLYRCVLHFEFFFPCSNKGCFAVVVDGGGFHKNWDLGSQEILPSFRTLTKFVRHHGAERIFELPDEKTARVQPPGCQRSSCGPVRRGRGGDLYTQRRGAR